MRVTSSKMDELKGNSRESLLKLHVAFQYLSPIAVVALLSYFVGTMFFNPSWDVVLVARVALTLFFSLEFLVEFILYDDKWKFVRHYWWRAALIVPFVGILRFIGQLAYLSQLLSVVKMTEEAIESLDYYGYIQDKDQ